MHAIPVYVHGVGGRDTCICGEWEGKHVSLPPGQLAYHPGRGIYGWADIFRRNVGEPTCSAQWYPMTKNACMASAPRGTYRYRLLFYPMIWSMFPYSYYSYVQVTAYMICFTCTGYSFTHDMFHMYSSQLYTWNALHVQDTFFHTICSTLSYCHYTWFHPLLC